MLEDLKEEVYKANMMLPRYGLVMFTWGNVSGIDRKKGIVVIKPSGVEYETMDPKDMAVVDLDGKRVEAKLNPSSDTPTHIELYKAFSCIGGIVHTHSRWATIFAQCGMAIPPLGTTHADYFCGEIPCTRKMTPHEIDGEYEKSTGTVIVEKFNELDFKADGIPAALVHSHGPFTWGKDAFEAVHNAVILEEIAMMAWHCLSLSGSEPIQNELLKKHFFRKHGENAYYGQKK
jgi:L-ribulose-5-phosphate 4-epimerase